MKQPGPIARAARLGLDVELRVIRNAGRFHPSHWHDDLQIIATIEGWAEAIVEGQTYALRQGSLIVIPPGAVHTANAPPGGHWTFQSLHAAPERLGATIARPVLSDPTDPADRLTKQFFRVTAALFEKGRGADALSSFAQLLSEIGTRGRGPSESRRAVSACLLEARAALAADLGDPVSVAGMAARCGWSAGHFSRAFQRAFFMPPLAWRLNARLEAAKRHLRQGASVSDAAAAAGFADLSHFSRQYRRGTGITARTYAAGFRRQLRQDLQRHVL